MAALLIRLRFLFIFRFGRAGGLGPAGGDGCRIVVDVVADETGFTFYEKDEMENL